MESTPPAILDPSLVRAEHLTHEATIRSIGQFFYFIAFLLSGVAAYNLFSRQNTDPSKLLLPLLLLTFAVIYIRVGIRLCRLDSKGKLPAALLACLGIFKLPVGALFGGSILYLLYSDKSNVVFSDEYKAVIAATPEIKYQISRGTLSLAILVIFIMLLFVFGIYHSAR